jgi:osmotically-inducible protein OsmY
MIAPVRAGHPPTEFHEDSPMRTPRRVATLAVLLATTVAAGCAAVAVGTAGVATMAALDRRTIGAQTEDTEIELRVSDAIPKTIRDAGRVITTSYNRKVLLTGQVPDEAMKRDAEAAAQRVPNVRGVHNELEVGMRVSTTQVATDSATTAKVKTAFLQQKDLNTNVVKVVTENNVVYLMGLVTQAEGQAHASAASRVSGVKRVVTLFEYISDEELKRISAR